MSQQQTADALGVSASTVKNWENPRTQAFPYREAHELARLYGVDYWWLLDGRETGDAGGGVPSGVHDELREIRRLLDDLLATTRRQQGNP